jgi:hypothetical protein
MVDGREDFMHSPALFISFTDEYPDGFDKSDTVCGFEGVDFCTFNL